MNQLTLILIRSCTPPGALVIGGVNVHNLDVFPANAGFVYGLGNSAATLSGQYTCSPSFRLPL